MAYAYAVAYAAYEASWVVLASFGPGFASVLPAVAVAAVRSASTCRVLGDPDHPRPTIPGARTHRIQSHGRLMLT